MIVSFLTVADWSIHHRLKIKVLSNLLRTVVVKIPCVLTVEKEFGVTRLRYEFGVQF